MTEYKIKDKYQKENVGLSTEFLWCIAFSLFFYACLYIIGGMGC